MSAVVLITGASTGFGRNAAERLARRGHRVFATMRDIKGRNAEHRDALERLAVRESLPLHVLELDVTDDQSVQKAVQGALQEAGRLDVVINNAGVAGIGVTEAFTLEQVQQIFDVNFFSVVRVNRAVLPSMRQQRSGLLIHVSSAAGRVVVPGLGAYLRQQVRHGGSCRCVPVRAPSPGHRFRAGGAGNLQHRGSSIGSCARPMESVRPVTARRRRLPTMFSAPSRPLPARQMHPAVTRSPKPSSGSLNCRAPSVRSERSSVLQ